MSHLPSEYWSDPKLKNGRWKIIRICMLYRYIIWWYDVNSNTWLEPTFSVSKNETVLSAEQGQKIVLLGAVLVWHCLLWSDSVPSQSQFQSGQHPGYAELLLTLVMSKLHFLHSINNLFVVKWYVTKTIIVKLCGTQLLLIWHILSLLWTILAAMMVVTGDHERLYSI